MLVVNCQCGASFSANPSIAGTTVACPTCGQPMVVPHPAPPTASVAPAVPPAPPAKPAAVPVATVHSPPVAPPATATASGGMSVLKILGIVGASVSGFVVVCIVLVIALSPSNKATESPEFATGNEASEKVRGKGDTTKKSVANTILSDLGKKITKPIEKGQLPKDLGKSIGKAISKAPGAAADVILGKDEDRHFKDVAAKVGLNYMSPDVKTVHHIRVADALRKGFRFRAPHGGNGTLARYVGTDPGNIEYFTVGVWSGNRGPVLVVARTLNPASADRMLARSPTKKKLAGKDYYLFRDGLAFCLIDSRTILCGTEHEVQYGIRFGSQQRRYRGFDWIDFPAYHHVSVTRDWGFNLFGRQFVANGTHVGAQRQKSTIMGRHPRALVAQSFHENNVRRYALLEGKRQPTIRDFPGLILIRDADKREAAYQRALRQLERQRENHQKIYKGKIEFTPKVNGQVVLITQTDLTGKHDYFSTHSMVAANAVKGVLEESSYNWTKYRDRYQKDFDARKFKDDSAREQLRHNLAMAATNAHYRRDVAELLVFAEETEDWIVRARAVTKLGRVFNSDAVIGLAKLSETIDLRDALGLDGDKSTSQRKGSGRRRSVFRGARFDIKILQHYLLFAANDEVAIAAARVLEELRIEKSEKLLALMARDGSLSNPVRQAVSRAAAALKSSTGRNEKTPKATSLAEAKKFLTSQRRVEINADLRWFAQATPSGDRLATVKLLVPFIDEELSQPDAEAALKKWLTPKSSPELIKFALSQEGERNYLRMKSDKTMEVIVGILENSKDSDGLLNLITINDRTARRAAVSSALKLNVKQEAFVAQFVVDASTSRKTETARAMKYFLLQVKLAAGLKKPMADTARKLMTSLRGTAQRDAQEVLIKCGNWDNRVDELLRLHFKENLRSAQSVLVNMGSKIESKVWPYLSDRSIFAIRNACLLLGKIGTEKSVPQLQKLLSNRRTERYAKPAIQEIEVR